MSELKSYEKLNLNGLIIGLNRDWDKKLEVSNHKQLLNYCEELNEELCEVVYQWNIQNDMEDLEIDYCFDYLTGKLSCFNWNQNNK